MTFKVPPPAPTVVSLDFLFIDFERDMVIVGGTPILVSFNTSQVTPQVSDAYLAWASLGSDNVAQNCDEFLMVTVARNETSGELQYVYFTQLPSRAKAIDQCSNKAQFFTTPATKFMSNRSDLVSDVLSGLDVGVTTIDSPPVTRSIGGLSGVCGVAAPSPSRQNELTFFSQNTGGTARPGPCRNSFPVHPGGSRRR